MRARHPFFLFLGACVIGGMIGALVNSVALWAAGAYGLKELAQVRMEIPSSLNWAWLKPRILWGGIWGAGFTFLAGPARHRLFLAALVFSLAPSAVQLFYIFPRVQNAGEMGMNLGTLTPVFVLVANALYALVMALWVRITLAEK